MNKKLKLLLYCTKSKSRLFFDKLKQIFTLGKIKSNNDLNGKIVGECDFEVEKITTFKDYSGYEEYDIHYQTAKRDYERLLQETCLNNQQLDNYLLGESGYAIHIKNLHIFDEPKELSDYYTRPKKMNTLDGYAWVNESLDRAPQNMMYCCDEKENDYILISIQSQWMCLILNRIKDVEVRRVVLKEMLNNE